MFVKGNQKYNNWEIYDTHNKKIGFLSVNIKSKPLLNLNQSITTNNN